MINYTLKQIKTISILVIGLTILLFGLILLFLPGPGILIIFLGLAVLATEFIWARKILKKMKKQGRKAWNKIK